MPNEQAIQLRIVMTAIKTGIALLNQRLFTLMSLLVASGLFAWVMYQPDYTRLAAACLYALLVNWRVYYYDVARHEAAGETQ